MKQRRSLLLSHLVSLCEDKEAHRRRIAYGRWITRETGEDQVSPSFLPFLLLPLLSPSIDHRRSISTVSAGSGQSAYQDPVRPVYTTRTGQYRMK
ncbi:hypothetical protein BHE74_00056165 [Ensete ventricosum]|nr:hypothetical protein BHE74_00056165 [Ensete ventricosum]